MRESRDSESERGAGERLKRGFGGVREKSRGESEKRCFGGGKREKKVGILPTIFFLSQKI